VPGGQQATERDKGGCSGETDNVGGMEDAPRMEREEREWTAAILDEERCLAVRLRKKVRIQRAWRLSMKAKKLARMTRMLEELSMEDMEMEVESIEMIVIEDWAEEDDIDWQEDEDGEQVMPEVKVIDWHQTQSLCPSP
jgi:hypothetical protein